MAEYKIVLNDTKSGKSYQKEIKDAEADFLKGKKVGEKIKGDELGLAGYEFEITGGSDKSGFPMRKDVDTDGKKKILIVSGTGIRPKRKGMRVRKTVAGNTVSSSIVQVNMKILKMGKEKLGAPAETKEESK